MICFIYKKRPANLFSLFFYNKKRLINFCYIEGAYSNFKSNELDQIIKYHFTESIFDIIVLSSLKAILLFVFVSELENDHKTTASRRVEEMKKYETENNSLNKDSEALIEPYKSSNTAKIFHFVILVICLLSCVYTVIKFALVLNLIIIARSSQDHDDLPMDYFYFGVLTTEMGFSLIQLIFSLLSWKCMNTFVKQHTEESIAQTSNPNEKKKINLDRLLALSFPECYLIIMAFIMLVASSVTNIVVPFFFGSVIDAALKYQDLSEMNKYIIYMFVIYFSGSVAGGLRSWLFELAGQRVVARLRLQVFNAIIKQDIEFFDTNRTGELTSRISSDTQVLQNAVTVNLSMLARYLIQIVGSVVFMLSLEPSLTGKI